MSEVFLWVPDLDPSKGGVQTFSHFLGRALGECVPAPGLRIVSKHGLSGGDGPPVRGFGGVPSALRTPWFAAGLLASARRRRGAVVISSHVNFLPMAHLLKRLRGVRYAGVAHGVEAWGKLPPRIRSALRAADHVWCVSRHTRDRVGAEQGIPPERLAVLPNTFESDRFLPGERSAELLARYRLPADAKIIFTFGRLAASERYKGFERIIAALPRIQAAVPTVRYVIGGTGDDQPRLAAAAQAAGVTDRVIFTGFLPMDELRAHYNLCDVFAMPSTGEGFGIVFLEALACGKPVLAGNVDGSTEPLADGRFGALVNPLEVEQLAGTLTQILQRRYAHPLMWQPDELRRQVVAEFGFDRFAAIVKAHFQRLLSPVPGLPR